MFIYNSNRKLNALECRFWSELARLKSASRVGSTILNFYSSVSKINSLLYAFVSLKTILQQHSYFCIVKIVQLAYLCFNFDRKSTFYLSSQKQKGLTGFLSARQDHEYYCCYCLRITFCIFLNCIDYYDSLLLTTFLCREEIYYKVMKYIELLLDRKPANVNFLANGKK